MGNCVSCNSAQSGKYEVADTMEQTNGDMVKTTEANGTSSETKINGHANGEMKQNGTHSINGITDGDRGDITQNGVVTESRDVAENSELKQNGISHDEEIKVTAVAAENVAVTADEKQEFAPAAAKTKIAENDADVENGNEQQLAEDEEPVDEGTAALRIQTKYRQYQAKKVVDEMKKDHEEHEHGTETDSVGHAERDLPHSPESAEGYVTVPSDDTTQTAPPAAAPAEAEHHFAEHTDEEKALAAVKIQAGLRGMRDRKYVKALKTQDNVIESHLPPPEQATTSDVTEQSLPAPPSSDVTEQAPAPPSSDVTEETPLPPPSSDAAPADSEAAISSDTASTSDAQ